jgi:hypothetical protein
MTIAEWIVPVFSHAPSKVSCFARQNTPLLLFVIRHFSFGAEGKN